MNKPEPNPAYTLDSTGRKPDAYPIGSQWKHFKNNHVYVVLDYVWRGDDDTWELLFSRVGGTGRKYSRSINNFEERINGVPRFTSFDGVESSKDSSSQNSLNDYMKTNNREPGRGK